MARLKKKTPKINIKSRRRSPNNKREEILTPEEITAWAVSIAGGKTSETAKKFKVTPRTIQKWIKHAREHIGEEVNINDFRTPLYGLFPLVVESLIHNLKKFDVTTTLGLAKGLQIFVEKQESDVNRVGNMSDAELDNYIEQNYANLRKPSSDSPEPRPGNC